MGFEGRRDTLLNSYVYKKSQIFHIKQSDEIHKKKANKKRKRNANVKKANIFPERKTGDANAKKLSKDMKKERSKK